MSTDNGHSPEVLTQIGGQTYRDLPTPSDRIFRDAWVLDEDAIVVDMDRAREIHTDRLRLERIPLLGDLDIAVVRADEINDSAARSAAIAAKQVLRDITEDPRIAAAETPEQLTALTIEVLTS